MVYRGVARLQVGRQPQLIRPHQLLAEVLAVVRPGPVLTELFLALIQIQVAVLIVVLLLHTVAMVLVILMLEKLMTVALVTVVLRVIILVRVVVDTSVVQTIIAVILVMHLGKFSHNIWVAATLLILRTI